MNLNKEILLTYNSFKKKINEQYKKKNLEKTMKLSYELWMFMNRFRNCDLKFYYDEKLTKCLTTLNKKKFVKKEEFKEKTFYRIAYIISNFSNTGGASIPHRFMLEETKKKSKFEQYVLVSNLSNKDLDQKSEPYRYLKNNFDLKKFTFISKTKSWLEKANYIENWIHSNKIDFVIVDPCPASIYAIASKPAIFHAIMSQDCYTYTIGPGAGDFTFLVTYDQIFKYDLKNKINENNFNVVMLPLHSKDYIQKSKPLNLNKFNIPKDAVISATSNMWKVCFGDNEVLLELIANLARKYPNYHHIFLGTERCLDNLTFFLNKNKDIEKQIHFIGAVNNIYSLLKKIDFWINSFPTSGGSNIEAALVGIPSIDLTNNRNLNLHSVEFMNSRECSVTNRTQFFKLADKLINNKAYRVNLGKYLKTKISREFDKYDIIDNSIHQFFEEKYLNLIKKKKQEQGLELENTLKFEKFMSVYSSFGTDNWTNKKKVLILQEYIKKYPLKPYSYIKLSEIIIQKKDKKLLVFLEENLHPSLYKDPRILASLSLCHYLFNSTELAHNFSRQLKKLKSKYFNKADLIADKILNNKIDKKKITFKNFYDY